MQSGRPIGPTASPSFQTNRSLSLLRSTLSLRGILNRRMRRGESRDWDAEGRAAHIIQADLVAEDHRLRVTTMFAADSALQIGAGLPAEAHGHVHQLAHAARIEALERIALQDFFLQVIRQEAVHVVAAVA